VTPRNVKETKTIGKGKPGPGRPKGLKNKLTLKAKQAFEHAFNATGGQAGLATWGKANRTEFYKLFARLIPLDITSGEQPLPSGVLAVPVALDAAQWGSLASAQQAAAKGT